MPDVPAGIDFERKQGTVLFTLKDIAAKHWHFRERLVNDRLLDLIVGCSKGRPLHCASRQGAIKWFSEKREHAPFAGKTPSIDEGLHQSWCGFQEMLVWQGRESELLQTMGPIDSAVTLCRRHGQRQWLQNYELRPAFTTVRLAKFEVFGTRRSNPRGLKPRN